MASGHAIMYRRPTRKSSREVSISLRSQSSVVSGHRIKGARVMPLELPVADQCGERAQLPEDVAFADVVDQHEH